MDIIPKAATVTPMSVARIVPAGIVILLWAAINSTSLASAPSHIVGYVFSQTSQTLGAGDARTFHREDLWLQSNDMYRGLLAASRLGASGPRTYAFPAGGTWSYRKTGETTGELTIDGVVKSLTFETSTSGTLPRPNFITTVTFTLVPYDSAAPLTNCSNRSFIRAGGTAFTGFVVTSSSRSRILVRAIGPGLGAFGVTDAIQQPVVRVRGGPFNAVAETNQGWADHPTIIEANAKVAAFPLAPGSKDAATLFFAEPGAYIAEVTSADPTESGQVLIEVYLLP